MKFSKIRVIAICILATAMFASCASKKQYGCPGHISFDFLNICK